MNTGEKAILGGQYVNPWNSWREKRMKAAYYLLTNKPSEDSSPFLAPRLLTLTLTAECVFLGSAMPLSSFTWMGLTSSAIQFLANDALSSDPNAIAPCPVSRCFPDTVWCIPTGCTDLIASTINRGKGKRRPRIWEAVWWDERTLGDSEVRLIYTPAQHWSGRNTSFDNESVGQLGFCWTNASRLVWR
ncbi:acyl phosphatidylethanolamine hydrolyzing [Echinococcus multilocularis]|uniref:Acyl phosphatidylethanolamine phospholipase n=1 Tax=Echinococcus multilocularis TaxID=6211 RepID=A0A087VZ87_ECHMU|nr:acyl phosphatidylethanolamine hydrolyzing [Echinococcus multilocularis]